VVCSCFPLNIIGSPTVQKSILFAAIQKEIQRHDFLIPAILELAPAGTTQPN
jgi:hypothetical protein